MLVVPGTAFGDIALVPAPFLKRPKGIRDVSEWYMATAARRDYVWQIFEKQCEFGLQNLRTLIGLFGSRPQAAMITGKIGPAVPKNPDGAFDVSDHHDGKAGGSA